MPSKCTGRSSRTLTVTGSRHVQGGEGIWVNGIERIGWVEQEGVSGRARGCVAVSFSPRACDDVVVRIGGGGRVGESTG